jgi:hypothetical protein
VLPILGWDATELIAGAVALLAGLGLFTYLVTVVARGQRVPFLGEPPWGRRRMFDVALFLTIFGMLAGSGWLRIGVGAAGFAYLYAVTAVHNKRLPQHEPDDVDVS